MAWALLALVVPMFALIIVLVIPRKTVPTYANMQPLDPPPPPPVEEFKSASDIMDAVRSMSGRKYK
jgi:hypothetical protein